MHTDRSRIVSTVLFNPDEGYGVKVQTRGDVAFSVLHYSDEALKKANHTWELKKGNVYAHFDCAQKGIGNGSCGNVATLDKYLIKNGAKYNCSLLFTPVNDIESGIEDVTENVLRFNVSDGNLVCKGNIAASTSLAVYNMGGVKVAETHVQQQSDAVVIPLNGLPHGSYIVAVKGENGMYVYKFVL